MKITINKESDLVRKPVEESQIDKKCPICSYQKQTIMSCQTVGDGGWKHRWFGHPACYGGKFNGYKAIWFNHSHYLCKRCGNEGIVQRQKGASHD